MLKFKQKNLKKLHDIGTRLMMETFVSLHENVVGFEEDCSGPSSIVSISLHDWVRMTTCDEKRDLRSRKLRNLTRNDNWHRGLLFDLLFARLSPRRFGEPSSRDRCWRILLNPEKAKWACQFSFEELADVLLLPLNAPFKLSPKIYMYALTSEEGHLSDCAKFHLQEFERLAPNKRFYDVASNPNHRFRTETADGALMTFCTNSTIWFLVCNEFYSGVQKHLLSFRIKVDRKATFDAPEGNDLFLGLSLQTTTSQLLGNSSLAEVSSSSKRLLGTK